MAELLAGLRTPYTVMAPLLFLHALISVEFVANVHGEVVTVLLRFHIICMPPMYHAWAAQLLEVVMLILG